MTDAELIKAADSGDVSAIRETLSWDSERFIAACRAAGPPTYPRTETRYND